MVSIAGILANLLLAIIGFTVMKTLIITGVFTQSTINEGFTKILYILFYNLLFLNVSLAIFNLLPFPPLDGSKILSTFLPESFQPVIQMLEQFGFIILMALLYFGVIGAIMSPVRHLIEYLLITPWF
jgi:Zn-dependent protease